MKVLFIKLRAEKILQGKFLKLKILKNLIKNIFKKLKDSYRNTKISKLERKISDHLVQPF